MPEVALMDEKSTDTVAAYLDAFRTYVTLRSTIGLYCRAAEQIGRGIRRMVLSETCPVDTSDHAVPMVVGDQAFDARRLPSGSVIVDETIRAMQAWYVMRDAYVAVPEPKRPGLTPPPAWEYDCFTSAD